jgi:hypothetical protein
MVGVIKEIISNYFEFFTDEQIDRIIEVLLKSAKFAREFNDQIYLRFCLWKSGIIPFISIIFRFHEGNEPVARPFETRKGRIYRICHCSS